MIKLTSNFVNQTMVLQHILPDQEHISRLMDTAFEKFYVFGRSWITTQVRKILILFDIYISYIGGESSTTSCRAAMLSSIKCQSK